MTINLLALDYGQKNIGTAVSVLGIITPTDILPNNSNVFKSVAKIISDYKIQKIILGYTNSPNKKSILSFKKDLETIIKLPIELVDENLSTKQAQEVYKTNRNFHKKHIVDKVDSIAAAVILSRYYDS